MYTNFLARLALKSILLYIFVMCFLDGWGVKAPIINTKVRYLKILKPQKIANVFENISLYAVIQQVVNNTQH